MTQLFFIPNQTSLKCGNRWFFFCVLTIKSLLGKCLEYNKELLLKPQCSAFLLHEATECEYIIFCKVWYNVTALLWGVICLYLAYLFVIYVCATTGVQIFRTGEGLGMCERGVPRNLRFNAVKDLAMMVWCMPLFYYRPLSNIASVQLHKPWFCSICFVLCIAKWLWRTAQKEFFKVKLALYHGETLSISAVTCN